MPQSLQFYRTADAPGTDIDTRTIALVRIVLAIAAFAAVLIDPTEPNRLVPLTYSVLALHLLYAVVIFLLAPKSDSVSVPWFQRLVPWIHWVDIAWYILFISLTRGTNSLFFIGLVFPILIASFRGGFASGLQATIVSVALFATVGSATAPAGEEFELNRSLLRPIYLLVLGYMMAFWGGFEITLKRRLALLREVSTLSNPRFGVDRTINSILQRLSSFYSAEECLLVMQQPEAGTPIMYRATPDTLQAKRMDVPAEILSHFVDLPADEVTIYNKQHPLLNKLLLRRSVRAFSAITGERRNEIEEVGTLVAAWFGDVSLITVPLSYGSNQQGRIFITSARHHFNASDAQFVMQVFAQVMAVIQNIRLVDRLASDAAQVERQKIAHDIHDTVIQPYIGLQIGLSALRRKAAADPDTVVAIDKLVALINNRVDDMRTYISGLRSGSQSEGSVIPAVRRFAERFSQATDIDVRVEAPEQLPINDRLSAELFQMITEALSNIRRHTHAERATICLQTLDSHVILRVDNDGADGRTDFTPKSITERAEALGGIAQVEHPDSDTTSVVVQIPL